MRPFETVPVEIKIEFADLKKRSTCLPSEADGMHFSLRECLQSRFLTTVFKLKAKKQKNQFDQSQQTHSSKNQSKREVKTRDLYARENACQPSHD